MNRIRNYFNNKFPQNKNDAESLCEDMNKYLEKYWLENKGDNTNDWEVNWITKYQPETMRWVFLLEHEACGTIITKWRPDLTIAFINEWLKKHNC